MSVCTKDGSDPFCQLPHETSWSTLPFVQCPCEKHTFLIYFASCSLDYFLHSKECKEIGWVTLCRSEGDISQEPQVTAGTPPEMCRDTQLQSVVSWGIGQIQACSQQDMRPTLKIEWRAFNQRTTETASASASPA